MAFLFGYTVAGIKQLFHSYSFMRHTMARLSRLTPCLLDTAQYSTASCSVLRTWYSVLAPYSVLHTRYSVLAGALSVILLVGITGCGRKAGSTVHDSGPYPVSALAFSADGKKLAASFGPRTAIWDPQSGKEL